MKPSERQARAIAYQIETTYRPAWYHLTDHHRASVVDEYLLATLTNLHEETQIGTAVDLQEWITETRELVIERLATRKLHIER